MDMSGMKKPLITTLPVLLICVSVGSAHAYANSQFSFSIDPPSGWTVEEPSYAVVAFLGPIDEGFQVNINIQVEPTSLSLAEYVSASRADLQAAAADFNLISEGARNRINDADAYEAVFTFAYSGQTIKEKQVYLVKSGDAFVITYAALPTTYQTHLPDFEISVQTLGVGTAIPYWLWIIITVVVVATVGAIVAIVFARRRRLAKTVSVPHTQIPPPPT